jgi:hypothetical protein
MVDRLKSNKFWVIILSAALLVSAVAAFLLARTPASIALIELDGVLIERLDLSIVAEPYSFTVESNSGFNIISVDKGRIRISESDCPDGICVRQGWISGGSVPIVCLPHRLIIRLEGGETPIVDAIVG